MEIPALTLSGGTLKKFSDAKQFRVWHHPKKGGDYYYEFTDPVEAKKHSEKSKTAEPPLAVIFDRKYWKWREVVIPKRLMKVI
jgi:hypothetical protein